MSQLLAPVCPFLAEKIYRDLTDEKSVHLTEWPVVDEKRIDEELSAEINTVQKIISAGLAIRGREKIKVRQPLASATVALPAGIESDVLKTELATIQEELNVKKIEFAKDPAIIAETVVNVNARALGPRLGKKVQECIKEAKAGKFEVKADGVHIAGEVLTGEEVSVGFVGKEGSAAESEAGIVVALDTKITPELKLEGRARDLVRAIQDLRKQAGYDVSDRIELGVAGADEVLKKWAEYIQAETLAKKLSVTIETPDAKTEVEGIKITIKKLQK